MEKCNFYKGRVFCGWDVGFDGIKLQKLSQKLSCYIFFSNWQHECFILSHVFICMFGRDNVTY